jgi:hypothetical protein
MEFAKRGIYARTVFRISVRKVLRKCVMRRENDGVDCEARIADNVFDGSADMVYMIMRNKPIKMKHLDSCSFAECKKSIKSEGGLGHTAVMEDVVTV